MRMLEKTVGVARWAGFALGMLILLLFIVFMIGERGHPPLFKPEPATLLTWCLVLWFASLFISLKSRGVGALLGIIAMAAFFATNYFWVGRLPGGPVFPLMWLPPLAFAAAWLHGRATRQKNGEAAA